MKKFILLNLLFILPYQINSMEKDAAVGYMDRMFPFAASLRILADAIHRDHGINLKTPGLIPVAEKFEKTVKMITDSLNVAPENIAQAVQKAMPEIKDLAAIVNESPERIAKALEVATQRSLIPAMQEFGRVWHHSVKDLEQVIEKGAQVVHQELLNPFAAQIANPLAAEMRNGVKLWVDPNTVKTIGLVTVGAIVATLGALVIYKYINDDTKESDEVSKPANWKNRIKNFVKSKGFLGGASMTAGLALILKSNTLAARI